MFGKGFQAVPNPTNHLRRTNMNSEKPYKGSCFCGAVELSVSGEPVAMGYCHCESCRHWSASPVNAFTLWSPESVTITQGSDNLGTYNKTPHSSRKWCKTCGGTCSPNIRNRVSRMSMPPFYRNFPFNPDFMSTIKRLCCTSGTGCPK